MVILPSNFGVPSSWEKAKSDLRATDDSREALDVFRSILGDEWEGWKQGAPLANQFLVSFQGLASEGVRLMQMYRALKDIPGIDDVVREDLGKQAWPSYLAGVMAMEFCSRARLSGYGVELIKRGNGKTADTNLRVADRWLRVEFKALHDSDDMQQWYEFENEVFQQLARRGVHSAFFDRQLTEAALSNVPAVVEGLVSIANRRATIFEDLPEGTGRARCAEGLECSFGYPIAQKTDLERISQKMRSKKWWGQLENYAGPTLLVVRARSLLGDGGNAAVDANAAIVANLMHQILPQLPMISATLIYDEPFSAPAPTRSVVRDSFSARRDTSPRGWARLLVLSQNSQATFPLNELEVRRIAGAEIFW